MSLSKRYLILGALFGLCGMSLGVFMGAKENFVLAPVHAHMNLLGWVALTLYGLTYRTFPEMAEGRLPRVQFWTAALGVITIVIPLAYLLTGHRAAIPWLLVGEALTVATLLMFLANLWRNRHA